MSSQIELDSEKLKYLNLLANQYPTYKDACTEIINLQAIINLPKGTEHFVSDIHGEYESFSHVLKNASGVIKNHIEGIFGSSLRQSEIKSLATLIYYPAEKLAVIKRNEKNLDDWYKITLFRLVKVCKKVASKYTRSKVRKSIPSEYAYILEELIHEDGELNNKQAYYNKIISTIINLGRAEDYITVIAQAIQRLAIDQLHIIGDIYDRGPGADLILDELLKHHNLDIQWGNHDISWMGAAAGSLGCILNVIRISARYANLDTIEEGYGINLVPLAAFAMEYYQNDDCLLFMPENMDKKLTDKELDLHAKMHKAACILQFKVEAEIVKRHPEYQMNDRLLFDKIDFKNYTIQLEGKSYNLIDRHFPLIDPKDPFKLMPEEQDLLDKLKTSFLNSPKLQHHAELLFTKGGMYKVINGNLLFHGCIPISKDKKLKQVEITGKQLMGKALLDELDRIVREGFYNHEDAKARENGLDMMWYLWCGSDSPLYGKDKMATFERYFIAEAHTHVEEKNPYYQIRNEEAICRAILENFGLDPEANHIINGHVPVQVVKGESPIKANGKLFVIDGGFAKAYQKVTGIAGYTLIYNSYGLVLASHEPFESKKKAVEEEIDIYSSSVVLEYDKDRIKVGDTDIGKELKDNINDLMLLLLAYRKGLLKEKLVH